MKTQMFCEVFALLALVTATDSDLKVIEPKHPCQCQEIMASTCALHFHTGNWFARFPNARDQDLTQAVKEFVDFYQFLTMENYCSHMLYNLLCFHYFPKCERDRPELAATPCRETCNEALMACVEHARVLRPNYTFPDHLNCSNFPSGSNCSPVTREADRQCNGQCTACPNASIHVEFAGQTTSSGAKSNGTVEICLRLANVGSYDPLATLTENVTVHLLPPMNGSTEAGPHFVAQSSIILFPIGSEKGKILCSVIDVIRGDREEGVEFFRVFASIIRPSGAKIGGDIASTTDSILVKMINPFSPCPVEEATNVPRRTAHTADPAPEVPRNECRRLHCNWRRNISRNTFTNNLYSFIARVQVLGCGDSVLEVYMHECHDISCGVCPQTPVCTKLAICPNCQLDACSVGREVTVAGGNADSGSLFIANNRKKGLFSFEQDMKWRDFVPTKCKTV